MASSILSTANTASPIAAQSNTASTLRANRQSSANSAAANRSQASGQRPSQIGGNGARNNQMTERVDQLVARMEGVANQITSREVSDAQRSVLVARFNQLQRQVNELDGIVVSEGHGDSGQGTLSRALAAGQDSFNFNVDDEQSAASTAEHIRAVRSEIRTSQGSDTNSSANGATETLQRVQQAGSTARSAAASNPQTSSAPSDNSNAVDLLA